MKHIDSYWTLNRRARIERERFVNGTISIIVITILMLFVYLTSLKAIVGFFS